MKIGGKEKGWTKHISKKDKDGYYRCVYCGRKINYQGSCNACGRKEDEVLGKT